MNLYFNPPRSFLDWLKRFDPRLSIFWDRAQAQWGVWEKATVSMPDPRCKEDVDQWQLVHGRTGYWRVLAFPYWPDERVKTALEWIRYYRVNFQMSPAEVVRMEREQRERQKRATSEQMREAMRDEMLYLRPYLERKNDGAAVRGDAPAPASERTRWA